jgi:hypothetical protein
MGSITVATTHPFAHKCHNSFTSPYLQELLVSVATLLPYAKASALINQLTGINSNTSQVYSCSKSSAEKLQRQPAELPPAALQTALQNADKLFYVMIDGSMLFIDNRWQEVKTARIFAGSSSESDELDNSYYCAHIGHYSGFTVKLDALLAGAKAALVFVTDGAKWIGQYISRSYPGSQQVLDVYHVLEKLSDAAKQCGAADSWLHEQRQHLLGSSYGKLMHAVERLKWKNRDDFKKLRNYLLTNQYRMDYRSYKNQGLRIGSGPIESAQRTLLQQRMKLSGQRWKRTGADNMIWLRVLFANKQQHLIKQQLQMAA